MAVDFFGVDFEAFEEGLVEESAFGLVGLEVGGLDVVGELEGEVEDLEGLVVLDLVPAEELLGGGALAADAFLFFGEDVVADRVVVVGVEELAFLVVEAGNLGAGAGGFLLGESSIRCSLWKPLQSRTCRFRWRAPYLRRRLAAA